MELIPLNYTLTSATNPNIFRSRIRRSNSHLHTRYGKLPLRFKASISNYKQYDFQDFQGYAKPVCLLPATELKVCSVNSQETTSVSLSLDKSQSFFKVKIQTSNMYGSSLSDTNAGILLCLIDENGDSILQRIPAILKSDSGETDVLHFQRGSVDEFTFEGPKFGNIEALWVGVESGQWRVGDLCVTVIGTDQFSAGESERQNFQMGFQYGFEVDDVLLGEGGDMSIMELRPARVSVVSDVDSFTLLSKSPTESALPPGSNEESMKEYADLKLSLLSYDAVLIFTGTLIANISAGENAAFAFFIGGVGGFLYLLLIQRSVDGLPSSPSISKNTGGTDRLFGGFRGPISSLALVIGVTSLAAKYGFGDAPFAFTSKELLAGMMGFLACKVAIVTAAFKPMSLSFKEKE